PREPGDGRPGAARGDDLQVEGLLADEAGPGAEEGTSRGAERNRRSGAERDDAHGRAARNREARRLDPRWKLVRLKRDVPREPAGAGDRGLEGPGERGALIERDPGRVEANLERGDDAHVHGRAGDRNAGVATFLRLDDGLGRAPERGGRGG